ncbi:hypothetical protein VNI00_013733 [Paramarasmius palmivorus]|uniref:NmrA-like domain-containing protein n=1 Tax=Paramarasmius palmivorus TaxID=297713 RepID=A0AAW0BWN2_9AGAR
MSTSTFQPKTVLITGATGRQGHAVIHHLSQAPYADNFRILALTRNASSASAVGLKDLKNVEVVEGDLTKLESIRPIFEREKERGGEGGGIWGVFTVIAYPGLGVDADGEQSAGKNLATLSHEYQVQCFIYSGSDRAGEIYDDEARPHSSFWAKVAIERHIKELGKQGLKWTILRPTLFFENYVGPFGGTTFEVFKAGVKPDTPVQLLTVDDMGRIVRGIFLDPEPYIHQILVPCSDNLTFPQQEEIYKRATGRSISNVPLGGVVGKSILKMNWYTREMVEFRQQTSAAIVEGKVPEFQSQIDLATKALGPGEKWVSFEEWAKKTKGTDKERTKNWNGVSLSGLLSGRA